MTETNTSLPPYVNQQMQLFITFRKY